MSGARVFYHLCRLALAVIFVYAGAVKANDVTHWRERFLADLAEG